MGAGLLPRQGVEVGDEVATDPVHVGQGLDVDLLLPLDGAVAHAVERVGVAPPAHRLVRHAEGAEDVVVEAVGAQQELLDPLEVQARLGALDHPVVVGGGEGEDLGDAQLGHDLGIGAGVLGRPARGRPRPRSRSGRASGGAPS